jgi:hypothetical protein
MTSLRFLAVWALVLGHASAGTLKSGSASLDFGGQSINTTSPAKTLTITNAGALRSP